ncbi:MAG: A/G-specific adenine glycosylase [Bacteroidetes bacterium]|nr:A/G-specific adenine glycosylase [Bacteroidota bacterium]
MLQNTSNSLIHWFIQNKRELPWRKTKDPYKIWLSEIILQQTRVDQGLPYYNRFVKKYPTLNSLAKAPDDEVMKLWQGLGYYSRARNLLFTARQIKLQYKGKFPNTLVELKKLKGIGDYTAAAIASFAFNLKHPVLDGNVYRFMTRLFGIETPIDKLETKTAIMAILTELITEVNDPATFNQAIMEFGALHCTPQTPQCSTCPFNQACYAFKENKIKAIPVKGKSVVVRDRYFNYFVFVTKKDSLYIKKRTEKDVWHNLFDFPLIETTKPLAPKKLWLDPIFLEWTSKTKISKISIQKPVLHKLTHQNLYVTFYIVNITKFLNLKKSPIFEIEKNIINSFAVPKIIDLFLHSFIS